MILLDCDGVLSDYVSGAIRWLDDRHDMLVTDEAFTDFDILASVGMAQHQQALDEYLADVSFCRNMPVYPGAQEFVESLRKMGEIVVVTSPHSGIPRWCHDRTAWLGEHFGFSRHDIVFCSRKHLINGDCLIDDNGENCLAFDSVNLTSRSICFDRPWNRRFTNLTRALTYTEVLELIK